ncbi:hypothetical protein WN944_007435 [Citrus x changshan-huyou]|uniref:non-specific serine/threonine protein kinase n=1 Tax=Citrus x changshan-huyou TaxID=2935761 RepID=A0AAP0QUD7_9ROSI
MCLAGKKAIHGLELYMREDSTRHAQLDWKRRISIINGIARGLLYLHEDSRLKVIHRDLKAREALELMDPILKQSCMGAELLKFIHIGLLCVQEDPAVRPNMSSVAVMLASDIVTRPQPTQPAFSAGRIAAKPGQSSSSDSKDCSVNEVTLSGVSPR